MKVGALVRRKRVNFLQVLPDKTRHKIDKPCPDSESSSDTVPKPQSSSGCDNANIDRVQFENKMACYNERVFSMGPHSTIPDRPSLPPAPTLPPELNRPGQDELQSTTSKEQQQLIERVESRLLQSMDVIGLAIVNTFRNELFHLVSENTDLRAQKQNLIYKNLSLQCHQRAFQELWGYIPVGLWERLNTRVQLEIQQVFQAAVLDVQARSVPPVSQFVQQPQQTLPAQRQQHDQLASVLETLYATTVRALTSGGNFFPYPDLNLGPNANPLNSIPNRGPNTNPNPDFSVMWFKATSNTGDAAPSLLAFSDWI
ncbi:hypothetical protein SprV_0602063700 [Sparganum proliferum]